MENNAYSQQLSAAVIAIWDAAVRTVKEYSAGNQGAADCIGSATFYYALLPMIGQYLSLAQNDGQGSVLPHFKPIVKELGARIFCHELLSALNDGPQIIRHGYQYTGDKRRRGPLVSLAVQAQTTLDCSRKGDTSRPPNNRPCLLLKLYQTLESDWIAFSPRPLQEELFFPREFCAALARQALSRKAEMPPPIKLEGSRFAWQQCLEASLSAS